MKGNHYKCRLLFSFSTQDESNIQTTNVLIKNSSAEKILVITVDYKLRFDRYVENLCKKAGRNLNVGKLHGRVFQIPV